MKSLFDLLTVLCSLGAAVQGYRAYTFPMPSPPAGAFAEAVMPTLKAYNEASRQLAKINRVIVAFSVASALFAFLSLILGWRNSTL